MPNNLIIQIIIYTLLLVADLRTQLLKHFKVETAKIRQEFQ